MKIFDYQVWILRGLYRGKKEGKFMNRKKLWKCAKMWDEKYFDTFCIDFNNARVKIIFIDINCGILGKKKKLFEMDFPSFFCNIILFEFSGQGNKSDQENIGTSKRKKK